MKKLILRLTFCLTAIIFMGVTSCQKDDMRSDPQNSPPVSGKLIANEKNIPVEDIFYNDCCSEDVDVTGTAHFIITDNIMHVNITDLEKGIGLVTGYTYTSTGNSALNNVFYSNEYEGTLTFVLNMNNDNGCSFKLNITLHITINANGDVAAEIEKILTTCN